MPSRVSGAPFCAPRRLAARAPNPAAASSSAGIGEPASASHRPHSRSDRPEDAAARNRAHSRSWAAGPHRSRLVLSSTVRTKWAASRWAASTVASPASGFHHQRWREPVMRCGSNSHTRAARSGAQLRGGGPQVGLVGGGDDGAGRGQDVGDAQRGRLARPGRHERGDGVFPGREQGRAAAGGPLEVAEQQPGIGRRQRPRIGPGQRRAEPDGGLRGRDRRQRRDLRVAGERGDRVAGPRDARGDDPPRHGPGRDRPRTPARRRSARPGWWACRAMPGWCASGPG